MMLCCWLTGFAQYYPFLLDLVKEGKYDPSFVFTNVGKLTDFAPKNEDLKHGAPQKHEDLQHRSPEDRPHNALTSVSIPR
jgi:hypothetical protein